MSADVIAALPNPTAQPLPEAVAPRTHAWKDGSFGFRDLLDIVNPLQHIPVASAIYRRLTGDVPGNVAELAGDTLFGGPIGLGVGLFSIAFKEETGADPGEMALGLLTGGGTADATAASAAAASPWAPAMAAAVSSAHASDASAAEDGAPSAAPVAAVTAAPVTTAQVMPAHPPIPLHRPPVTPPAPDTDAANASAAESAFLARDMMMRRGLVGSRAPGAATATRTFTAPIPLQLTGQAAQVMPLRALPRASTVAPLPAAAAPPPATPGDIAQRMQDALDKYRRLEAQRAGAVDLRP